MKERVNLEQLDNVCLDCCEFIKHLKVEKCIACPIAILKLRTRKNKRK